MLPETTRGSNHFATENPHRRCRLPADEVVDDERPIGPRQHVIVQAVHLAEGRAHLADLRQQPAGSEVASRILPRGHAFFTERDEEIGTGIWIQTAWNDASDSCISNAGAGVMLLADRCEPARGAEKVTDHRHVRVEHLDAPHPRRSREPRRRQIRCAGG